MTPILRTALVSSALALAGAAALGTATDRFRAFTTEAARRIATSGHPVQIPPTALETQSGKHMRLADLRGEWLIVDFMYTRCPTYCLALGGEFARLQRAFAAPIAAGKIRLLSISFDPAHDTPPQLAAYQRRSNDDGSGWLAVRPVAAEGLRQLERSFGVTAIPDRFGGYTHNAAVYLVDPQQRLVEIDDIGRPDQVVQSLERKLDP